MQANANVPAFAAVLAIGGLTFLLALRRWQKKSSAPTTGTSSVTKVTAHALPGATVTDVQNFWDSRPCNVKHSQKEIGSKEYFDEVEKKRLAAEPHIGRWAQFDKWGGKEVLEVGCGIGTEGVLFARGGAKYTGFELSTKSLDICKQRFSVFGLGGEFFDGSAETLTTHLPPGKAYDLVYSFGVIHHTPNPKACIQQIRKVMKPDGELRIMLYAAESWKTYMIEIGLDQPEAQYGCPIAFTFTRDEIKELLHPEFRVDESLEIKQFHIFPYQIGPYKKGLFVKEPWFEAMPKQMFDQLQEKLGWHLLITAKPAAM